MSDRVHGLVRYEREVEKKVVLVNSGVSLAEAVGVWMESVKVCQKQARLYFEGVRGWQPWKGCKKDERVY